MTAAPWVVRGNDVGCVVLHGFSGTPDEVAPLAEALVAAGYTVSLPLLPGHGNNNEGLGQPHWTDWLATLHRAVLDLRASCRTVVAVGYSMGGALTLLETVRAPLDYLVLLAPALGLSDDWRRRAQLRLLPALKFAQPWFYPLAAADFGDPKLRQRLIRRSPVPLDLDDPAVQTELRRRIRVPMRAVEQFYGVALRAGRMGARLHQPTLIMHGRHDATIPLIFSEKLFARLGSADKTLRIAEHSDHALVNGPEAPALIAEILDWLAARVGPAEIAAPTQRDGVS